MIGSYEDHSSQNLKTKTQSGIFEKKGTKKSKPQGRILRKHSTNFLSSSNMYQGIRFTKHLMYAVQQKIEMDNLHLCKFICVQL